MRNIYLSAKACKLLKERGFDCETYSYFERVSDEDINKYISFHSNNPANFNITDTYISMPTVSEVAIWLSEKKHIDVFIKPNYEKEECYVPYIHSPKITVLCGHSNYSMAIKLAVEHVIRNDSYWG